MFLASAIVWQIKVNVAVCLREWKYDLWKVFSAYAFIDGELKYEDR